MTMTQRMVEVWIELPWLLSRKEAMRVTGLSKHALYRLVAEGRLHRHRAGVKGKFFKVELARLCRVQELCPNGAGLSDPNQKEWQGTVART